MPQKTIGDVHTAGQIREAVIRSLSEAHCDAVRNGDIEELERLGQSTLDSFVRSAASRPATPENIARLFMRAA